MSTWQIDPWNPYEDTFEAALLNLPHWQGAVDAIVRTFHEMKTEPASDFSTAIDGKKIYVVRIPRIGQDGGSIPSLLLAYTLVARDSLIQLLHVWEDAKIPEPLDSLPEPLRKDIQRCIQAGREQTGPPPVRQVLFPLERTSIDEKKLEEAVDRVFSRR